MLNLFSSSKYKPQSQTLVLTLDDQSMTLTINYRRNARRLTLRVDEDQLKVTAPIHISQQDVITFVRSKSHWIKGRLKSYEDVYDNTEPSILYHGIETPVRIAPDYNGHIYQMRYSNYCLWLDRPASARMGIERQIEKHLKEEAEQSIRLCLHPILQQLGEAPVSISIKDQKSRWGSCSTSRKLSFSWRLIMAPPEVLRYVVIHEAAHLKHHNHGKHFWSLVQTLMPEYDNHRLWLRQNQRQVMAKLDRRLAGLKGYNDIKFS